MAQLQKKNTKYFSKKWLLPALLPLTAAVWKLTDTNMPSYYTQPLHLQTELAADFGEVREDHFHMGLDIRTNGHENQPVYAVADGYISRVSIEESGYGKAIYITHPNGAITVYGHLNKFMDAVDDYVVKKQYRDECWQQDISFNPGMFPVKKGQQIALSGNTGNSSGPHLHFEIRNAKTGFNENPLRSGIFIHDDIPPVIHTLYWYNGCGSIYGAEANKVQLNIHNNTGTATHIITVNSPFISFGISADDKIVEDRYRLGIYSMKLYVDDKLAFCFAVNHFDEKEVRFVNACIDYSNWILYSRCIQLLRILPGNHLPVFENSPGNGIINLKDKKIHNITIEAADAAGNTTKVFCKVQYNGTPQLLTPYRQKAVILRPGKVCHIITANAVIDFTGKAMYDTLPLHITEELSTENDAASKVIMLHNGTVPLHDSIKVQIKTTLPAGSPLRRHVVMLLTNEKYSIPIKGTWKGDYMTGFCRAFGRVQLVIDTVSPVIRFVEGTSSTLQSGNALDILYHDNIGGAYSFRGELDGRWILFEKKGDLFTYNFDDHCGKGKHLLTVLAGDRAGNITRRIYSFIKE
ncbi:MAG TPA: M23 family metallopeptidase [Chitinophagaceae bacterium]|nr:M23 family metallopeptidase [Chitinophagaceae bacterium]